MPISVQCPRCNGTVSIADQAVGQRVKCPHCNETFLAPGVSKSASDDDDWLNLDEVPLAPNLARSSSAQPRTDKPSTPEKRPKTDQPPKGETRPPLRESDEALLADLAGDLDEFMVNPASPPKPRATFPDAEFSLSDFPEAAVPKPASAVEYASEYRVNCRVCGTFLYAKAHQAGKKLQCPDCHSMVTIPPPPKVSKKSEINIERAETFQFEETKVKRGPDPYKKSAEQLLEQASREEETEGHATYHDTPSVKEWALKVFGIFRDLGVVVHWLALSALAAVPAAIALKSEHPVLILGLFPFGFFLGVLVVSCGFAIMQAVASEEDSVTDWPTLDPGNWLSQLFVVVACSSLIIVPVWAVCMLIIGPSLISIAITMFAVYALFPFVLLSMLDMNSVMMPFSAELARSVTTSQEAWGGFYFSSGLLFVGLFLLFAIISGMGVVAMAVVGITAGVGVAFAYFAMLGRLAFAIGQAINAPPRNDDVDRTRHGDVS
jgi:DNA-directed RNA polymerase subunit M/transcription elongation factor TFIIS